MTNTKEFMMTEGTDIDFEELSAVSGGISVDEIKNLLSQYVQDGVETAKSI